MDKLTCIYCNAPATRWRCLTGIHDHDVAGTTAAVLENAAFYCDDCYTQIVDPGPDYGPMPAWWTPDPNWGPTMRYGGRVDELLAVCRTPNGGGAS